MPAAVPPPTACLDVDFWRDARQVAELLGDPSIRSCEVSPWTGGGGASADAHVLRVGRAAADGGAERSTEYFLKTTAPGKLGVSKAVGLAREGIILGVAPELPALARVAPKCLFAHGDMDEGKKVLVMHMVRGVQSGYFFGNHSPHNWGKDIAVLTASCPAIDEERVCCMAAEVAAKLHATAWGKEETLLHDSKFSALRSRGWARGEDQESWQSTQGWATTGWATAKENLMGPESKIVWDPLMIRVMDAAMARTTWEAYQAEWSKLTKTLLHGDFHPANMIVVPKNGDAGDEATDHEIVLLDWEVVGVGSGPQDLGQYMISHSTPASRRALAPKMIAAYVAALAAEGVETSVEAVMEEYVRGGLGRWLWLLPVCCSMEPAWVQYFQDQVAAFIHDHGITPETAPIVRA
mmetsp:Transcript_76092/g.219760  ORF Transcript_76092/g.219760 Transcript_76092/m.219760 type:complete len:408 (+) Transcript_76092:75-1298(+)